VTLDVTNFVAVGLVAFFLGVYVGILLTMARSVR
jgi:hypothetical protein